MLDRLRKIVLFFLWLLVGAFFVFVFLPAPSTPAERVRFGVTFTPSHARYLGLDLQQTYRSILDDLGVRELRLAAHWDDIEPRQGKWNFQELDWEIAEAAKRGARIVLTIGQKLPRWPECRIPAWAKALPESERDAALLRMLETVVIRYSDNPAVVSWQVENEPTFSFGACPAPDSVLFDTEVALVRRLDPLRTIIATDSGELGGWTALARKADVLGVSLYQMTWNPIIGYFSYPLPSAFYSRKSWLVKKLTKKPVIVSELQMEPWLPNQPIHTLPYSELEKSFTIERFRNNLRFAREAGFAVQYLWGVEWWAWAAGKGHSEFWQAAREVFEGRPLTSLRTSFMVS